MSFDMQDFNQDVLVASNSKPVVIDFWAEWCGPCRQLGPVIEKLAEEAGDRWKLVKINTDRHPDIAVQFGVRGIPAVKMVYQRSIIAEFTGAQPEHVIRKWLEENLPENGEEDSIDLLREAKEMLGAGERAAARELLEGEITEDSQPELKAKYAMLLLPDHPGKAREWFKSLENQNKFDIEGEAIDTVEHLNRVRRGELKPDSNGEEARIMYREAIDDLFAKEFESALEKFIRLVQTDRDFDDDGARKACIACFAMLGEQHPLTIKYRRRFSMSLY